ncbi:MAG: universal stress protein [Nitrosopumilus sp.]|nr:universal stress protein [Nitrosopumilus sp.]MDH3515509.1 universal stress protein [Nitrosopumilus sp.]MDH3565576.1 universal stress protein [Nitrosopumilus sp.]MDH5416727.1 universal stress protein [Nitrosopumilus sp.]MDH5555190.1 universal stress protein [Nitrosopumilus sp.]
MVFKNILVPYDGTNFSNRAFRKALDIAKKDDSKITVFTVIEGEYSAIRGFSKINPQIIKKQQNTAKKYIYKLEQTAKNLDVPISVKIKQGTSIIKEIISLAISKKSDLIVIGSHGRTGLNKLILGSVAYGVAHQAKCSVMVVK